MGNLDEAKLNYLLECGNGPDDDTGPFDCDWWTTPPPPGSAAATEAPLGSARAARRFESSARAQELRQRVAEYLP